MTIISSDFYVVIIFVSQQFAKILQSVSVFLVLVLPKKSELWKNNNKKLVVATLSKFHNKVAWKTFCACSNLATIKVRLALLISRFIVTLQLVLDLF